VPPEWTPDGKYILVGTRTPDIKKGMILYRIPAQGGKAQEMVLQQLFADRPTVHPDGRRIAFTTPVGFGKAGDVWVMRNFLPE